MELERSLLLVLTRICQELSQPITLLQAFKGSFIIAGTGGGRVTIWTFEFEEAFSTGK